MVKTGKFAKYNENEGLNTRQYCFANISATKAPIFMKFETQLHKIINNNQHHFCKDPSTHARSGGVNARAHVYVSCVRVCSRIFLKIFLVVLYYFMNLSSKFHKDRSFCCWDICKIVPTFINHQFSMYFPYSHNSLPQKSSKMDN